MLTGRGMKVVFLTGIVVSLSGCSFEGVQPFRSDGCSAWPDGNYLQCCIDHDREYWRGGTSQDRLNADLALQACVREKRGSFMASVMYYGTRMYGVPWLPFSWRWGFGQDFPDGYHARHTSSHVTRKPG